MIRIGVVVVVSVAPGGIVPGASYTGNVVAGHKWLLALFPIGIGIDIDPGVRIRLDLLQVGLVPGYRTHGDQGPHFVAIRDGARGRVASPITRGRRSQGQTEKG